LKLLGKLLKNNYFTLKRVCYVGSSVNIPIVFGIVKSHEVNAAVSARRAPPAARRAARVHSLKYAFITTMRLRGAAAAGLGPLHYNTNS
jgi:hypothetical protein